ncbi:MAG TPA: heparan-alpha-glucosaminide N-acetyltransferase domain-containing protein [Steroidobacteraceae bacterium]|jgi:hypothetical protein
MKENRRLLPIDAVRGTAMFFVGVSHISFYLLNSAPGLSYLLRAAGYVATPSFLLLSGLVCGYQLAATGDIRIGLRIVDRGLFVLLVGHLLVAGSLEYIVLPGTALEHIVITDVIGLLLCTAPLFGSASPHQLLRWGALLFVMSTAAGHLWQPTTLAGAAVAGPLLGINVRLLPDNGWISATLPLAGLFLFGVGIGKLINGFHQQGRTQVAWKALVTFGSVAAISAIAMNVLRHLLKPPLTAYFGSSTSVNGLLALLDIREKVPATPAYGLFYGGIGLTLVGLVGLLPGSRVGRRFRMLESSALVAANVGRASFVSYVSLQWLIDFAPRSLGLTQELASPVAALSYLAAVAVAMFLIARGWDRHRGNRWLTVGLKSIAASATKGAPKLERTA